MTGALRNSQQYVTRYVEIGFADPRMVAVNHMADISEAVEHASINLAARYHVRLSAPSMGYDSNRQPHVVVQIDIPSEIADTFSIGNHMRGVATYLLNSGGFPYREHLVGSRLLWYRRGDELVRPIESLTSDGVRELQRLKTEKETLCARIDELCSEVEKLREQVDTSNHNQTRNAREYARLCHENDRLRELVSKIEQYERCGCSGCPHEEGCDSCTLYDDDCPMWLDIDRDKRELGIEQEKLA